MVWLGLALAQGWEVEDGPHFRVRYLNEPMPAVVVAKHLGDRDVLRVSRARTRRVDVAAVVIGTLGSTVLLGAG